MLRYVRVHFNARFSFRITRCFPVCCLDLTFFFLLYSSDFEMLTNWIGRSNFFLLFGVDGWILCCRYVYGAGYCWIDHGWMDGWVDGSE